MAGEAPPCLNTMTMLNSNDIKKEIKRLTEVKERAYPNYPLVIKLEKQINKLKAVKPTI